MKEQGSLMGVLSYKNCFVLQVIEAKTERNGHWYAETRGAINVDQQQFADVLFSAPNTLVRIQVLEPLSTHCIIEKISLYNHRISKPEWNITIV